MPDFRRYRGFTAFVEGWGLYSESLGYDLGLYEDPYSQFGHSPTKCGAPYDWSSTRAFTTKAGRANRPSISSRIMRRKPSSTSSTRSIVTFNARAGAGLQDRSAEDLDTSSRAAESALGDTFDIREFHDELLGAGALPLDILEQRMDAWLEHQL